MEEQVQQALETLKRGGIILYPTDTVWGIGCDATNETAVARIFALKQRDDAKSMIVLLDRAEQVVRWVPDVPPIAWELWEAAEGANPLTLILPGATGLAPNLIPAERTVGIRLVQNLFCQRLIHRLGRPLVSTSANISGQPTPVTFDAIPDAIRQGVDWIADPSMEESTATHKSSSIIKLDMDGSFTILRP
ncbi:L-threonylcarbamoyladenylate synthase [Millionella massiliensis]|uniref:L-threonylcarbamoyladenylate synthase n=1 Tax=Millionella massiliensis TaxID=1871023 RepID=UPI0024B7F338|nr:L-threonylcarbamoyladenylate synthase [Millionella massiliensis]